MKLLLKSNSTNTRYKIFTISYKFPIINRLPHAPILEIKNNRKGRKEIANFGKFAWRVKVSNMYLSIYSTLVCCIRSWIMTFMESSKMQLDISYYIYIFGSFLNPLVYLECYKESYKSLSLLCKGIFENKKNVLRKKNYIAFTIVSRRTIDHWIRK